MIPNIALMLAAYIVFRALMTLFEMLKGGRLSEIGEVAQVGVAVIVAALVVGVVVLVLDIMRAGTSVAQYLPSLP